MTAATFLSPRARTPSRTVTSASCQLYFKLLWFNISCILWFTTRAFPRNSSFVLICAHWNGVNGFGTKNDVLATTCTFPFRLSFGIS